MRTTRFHLRVLQQVVAMPSCNTPLKSDRKTLWIGVNQRAQSMGATCNPEAPEIHTSLEFDINEQQIPSSALPLYSDEDSDSQNELSIMALYVGVVIKIENIV